MDSHEDFDVASLAAYLHLTPDQVQRMADRGRLPGRRIQSQWRFSRAEIHHWLEEQIGVSGDEELAQVELLLERQTQSPPSEWDIASLLSPSLIAIPLAARTKNSVIDTICQLAADAGKLWDHVAMAAAVKAREQLHPTALENGVALLHPRRPLGHLIPEPFLSLGLTPGGIPFGGPRGTLTDVFFLIGSTAEPIHLRILARLSRLIVDPKFLDALRGAEDAAAALRVISEADRRLGG